MAHTSVTKTHSQNTGVANTFSYSGSFDVFKGQEVVVTLDAVALTFTSSTINESASPREYTVDTSAKTIHIGGANLSSGTIIIRPVTDLGQLTGEAPKARATYSPGSSITSEDLNNNQTQLLRKALEYDADKMSTTGDTMTGHLTMGEDTTIIWEGATSNDHEITLTVADPSSDTTITLPNTTGTVVTTGDTGTVTATMMAANSVDSSELVDGSVDLSHMSANSVDSDQYVDGSIDSAHIADDQIDSQHYAAGSIDLEHMSANSVDSDQYVDGSIDLAHMSANSVDSDQYVDGSIDNVHLANEAVDTEELADNAVTIAKVGCEQTTITDSDSHLPTSGAVVDYVASIVNPIGGFEVIADDESFPNTIPAAGVVVSITDAAGLQVNSSGVSTNGDTLDNSTVTINGFPSELRGGVGSNADPYVFQAGAGLMVQSTGSSQTYNYHQAMIRESDFVALSDDINDFNNRYRIASSAPGSDNDAGDLYYDTSTDKMYVRNAANNAWGEVTSTGEFKYLALCVFNSGTGNAGVINGSISKYDLRETSTSGSLASITTAAQLIVSVNGVIQKPNTGTGTPSEGFAMVDAHTIQFGTNLPSGSSVFIIQVGSAVSIPTPGDNTVTAAKTDISIVEGDIIYGNGTDSWTRLPKGTAGQILQMNGGETAPAWTTSVYMPKTGGVFSGDVTFDNGTNAGKDIVWDESDDALEFADNTKIVLGTGSDYKISFNSSNTIFENDSSNTGGDVYFYQDDFYIGNVAKNETVAAFKSDGACELYYDNVKELETKSGGVKLLGHSEQAVNALGNTTGSTTIDFSVANIITATLTGATTFANPTTESVGQSGSIIVTQDGTGSRTLAWGTQFKWTGGTAPTLSTAANAVDRIDYLVVAADTIHCVASLDVK